MKSSNVWSHWDLSLLYSDVIRQVFLWDSMHVHIKENLLPSRSYRERESIAVSLMPFA